MGVPYADYATGRREVTMATRVPRQLMRAPPVIASVFWQRENTSGRRRRRSPPPLPSPFLLLTIARRSVAWQYIFNTLFTDK